MFFSSFIDPYINVLSPDPLGNEVSEKFLYFLTILSSNIFLRAKILKFFGHKEKMINSHWLWQAQLPKGNKEIIRTQGHEG